MIHFLFGLFTHDGASDWGVSNNLVSIFRNTGPVTRRRGRALLRRAARDSSGAAAVEFGLIAPALLLILAGIVDFGFTFNNYLELTDGVRVAARQFAISGSTATPMSTSTSAMDAAAANLTPGSITITYQVNGVACASDAACHTALGAASGLTATVTATYPCSAPIGGITVLSGCTMTSTTTDMIE